MHNQRQVRARAAVYGVVAVLVGVADGVGVLVLVRVGVIVRVRVTVRVGDGVRVYVRVGTGVRVRVGVDVLVGVRVAVYVAVGVGDLVSSYCRVTTTSESGLGVVTKSIACCIKFISAERTGKKTVAGGRWEICHVRSSRSPIWK